MHKNPLLRTARPTGLRSGRPGRRGLTLIETLIASALLGFSLIVMFGFHSQAVRSNMHARKMTDCTYLAQLKMEQLQAVPWTLDSGLPSTLDDFGSDPTALGSEWATLPHVHGEELGDPGPVNGQNNRTSVAKASYWVSWDVEHMDSEPTWVRLRVRCVYQDLSFGTWRGTTISSYRFRDS